ncbi:ChaN family lipoprotein [Desulfolithobacter sp.]
MRHWTCCFSVFSALSILLLIFSFLVGASPARAGDQNLDPLNHTLSLSFDLKNHQVLGTSRIDLPPNRSLTLYCGPLEITGTLLKQKETTPSTLKPGPENTLLIPSAPRPRTLYISWSLVAPEGSGDNLITERGITLAGFWHPMAKEDMLYTLQATLPTSFTAVFEAEKISSSQTRRGRVVRGSFPHPLRGLHFVAGPYTVQKRKVSSTTLYSYFFKEDAALATGYLNSAAAYIERYEQLIGPFPFKRFSIVENRLPTGYGMPSFTLLGQAVVRLPFIKDTSLGHEIVHSWFGNSVGVKDVSDGEKGRPSTGNWCEGLTTYLADQLYAADRGEDAEYRKNQLLRYMAYVHPDNTMTLAQFRGASDSRPIAKKIRAIGYDKASMVFHMLRKKIGDDMFYSGLQEFYRSFAFKRASWQDLQQTFSKVSGQDLEPFFTQWLTRPDIPKLQISQVRVRQENGGSQIRFHIVQQTSEAYQLLLPLTVTTLSDQKTEILVLEKKDQEFVINTSDLPVSMVMDPQYDTMRMLTLDETPPTWTWFMGSEKKTVILPEEEKENIYEPLIKQLENMGCEILSADKVKNSDLSQGSFLFLGPSIHSRSLFADPGHPASGFTLDVRKNPLNPSQVMVLVTSASATETQAVVHRLSHYGKYSYLHFEKGRIKEKRVAQTVNGIQVDLLTPPAGIPTRNILDFNQIVDDLAKSRVVYVGEMHTDYPSHLLQLQVIQALYRRDPSLAIGMEMFPRSSQQALDDYIDGKIKDEKEFIKASRYFKVWGYDYRMYQDIIGYAKKHRIPLVALNIDKKITSQVFREGSLDNLDEDQVKAIPSQRDLDVPGYRKRLQQIHSMHNSSPHGSSFDGFIQAQAIWDESMAESVAKYLAAHPDRRMVVIAGTGHVYKDSAIPERVARRMPGIKQRVVVSASVADTGTEQGKQVDYLMYTKPLDLPPAGKIGIVLNEVEDAQLGTRMQVVQLSPHGKAGEAGIKKDDLILALNGSEVHTIEDLKLGLLNKTVGDKVTLTVLRKRILLPDETLDIEVELSGLPSRGMMMPPGHPRR